MRKKEPSPSIGILLLAFGGSDSVESVEPFLKNVLAGRPIQPHIVERARERYRLIGGRSPLLDITKQQASSLEELLRRQGVTLKTYIGMRYWHPFIKDTIKEILEDNVSRVIAISMAPHNSKASTGGYRIEVERALEEFDATVSLSFVDNWHRHPLFLEAVKDKMEEALTQFPDRKVVHVIFSAHSLPLRLVEGDPYVSQLRETIEGLAELTGLKNCTLAYQSKGAGPGEWLGPDVNTVLEDLSRTGKKDVLLVPIGFVSDHVETLYDIDILYSKRAQSLGLNFRRSASLNASPKFIEALAAIVKEHI